VLAPEGFQFGRQDVDDLKSDPPIPGRIPGNIPEGREDKGCAARLTGEVARPVQQGRTKPPAAERRQDIELLDVEAVAEGAEPEGGDGPLPVEAGDPKTALLQTGFEKPLRRWRVPGDPGLRRAQEPLRGLALNVANDR